MKNSSNASCQLKAWSIDGETVLRTAKEGERDPKISARTATLPELQFLPRF